MRPNRQTGYRVSLIGPRRLSRRFRLHAWNRTGMASGAGLGYGTRIRAGMAAPSLHQWAGIHGVHPTHADMGRLPPSTTGARNFQEVQNASGGREHGASTERIRRESPSLLDPQAAVR